MNEPKWLTTNEVKYIHDAVLEKDGGASGLRDEGLLESALARPLNLFSYGETDNFQLAASYAEGVGRNHAFMDGNKRTALAASLLFLKKNGYTLAASQDYADKIVDLAQGAIDRENFANFLRDHALE